MLGVTVATRPQPLWAESPVIGFLSPGPREGFEPMIDGFRTGLAESGYAEGRNVAIEFRWAGGNFEKLAPLVADLVRLRVAVIVAAGGPGAHAAKAATTTIPIVIATGADPVALGFVASLAHPGGNITGVHMLSVAVALKRFELIREVIPATIKIGVLVHPGSPTGEAEYKELEDAARSSGRTLIRVEAASDDALDPAFADMVRRGAEGLIVGTDTFFNTRRDRLVALADRHRLPAVYPWRGYAASGGLISYGSDRREEYRLAGTYAGKILGGARPADMPVQQASRLELVINLRAAKSLNVAVSPALLARADEVIE
jgi:putative ABC transport system substrate-binding protein